MQLYRWQGDSGAEVLALNEPLWYNDLILPMYLHIVPQFCYRYGVHDMMKVYGVGDHGGGPTRKDLEMILDIEIFKNQGPIKEATLVPLVFPLLAGAGAFTTLLSLRAEYASVNIIIALILNMLWVYFVVSMTGRVERFLGKGGIYIIRKFFGIILLAISVRLFTANITLLIEALHKS